MHTGIRSLSLYFAVLFFLACQAHGQDSRAVGLTPEEKAWISAHPVILCAPDPDFRPAEFIDNAGVHRGLVADFIDLVFDRVGLEKRIVRFKSWSEVLANAREEKIDLVTAASSTPQRREFLDFTNPFIELPAVIIVRQQVKTELTMAQLSGMKVAVVKHYASHDFLAKRYPGVELDMVPDIQTGLRKVSFGMVDAMVANIATVSIAIEKGTIANLKVAGESGFTYRLSFAPIRTHTTLTGILNKGLATISPDEKRAIYSRWIHLEQPPGISRSLLLLAAVLAGAILLAALFVAVWNRSLKKVVDQKTRALTKEVRRHERAKQQSAESENRYRGIFEYTKSGVIVYRVEQDGKAFIALDANRSVLNIDRLEYGDIIGRPITDIFPSVGEFGLLALMREVWKTGRPTHFPSSFYRDDRIQGWRDYFVYKLPSNEIVTVYSDETSRITAERALRQSEEKLSGIIHSINDHMVMLDSDLTILWANRTSRDAFGDQIENQKCYTVFAGLNRPCPDCIARKCFSQARMQEREFTVTPKTGAKYDFWERTNAASLDKEGRPKTVVTIFRDITRRKALAAEAMRAGHLASIGELAAGVAHEINNPINSIINLAQLISDERTENGAVDDMAGRIMSEGKRIAGIVSSLLAFAKEKSGPASAVPLAVILAETLALTRAHLDKHGIFLVLDLPESLPGIQCHMQKIQQVFLNLINNARDALNQKALDTRFRKEIRISAAARQIRDRTFVRIIFEDNGHGISPRHLSRVTHPFFSTKPSGMGTGLGLSISHGIVTNHGGAMEIHSEEHQFTRVVLDLPAGGDI